MTKSTRANFVIIKNKNPDNDNPSGNPFRDFNKGRENDRDPDPNQNRNRSTQQDKYENPTYPVNERARDSSNRMISRSSSERSQEQRQEGNPNEKVFNTENTQRPRSREDYQRNTAGRVDGPDDLGLKRSSEDETNLNSRPADELKSGSEGSRLTSNKLNKMNWNDIQNKNQVPPKGDIGDQKRGYIDTEDKGMKGSWENENRLDPEGVQGYGTGKNQSKRGFSTINKKSDSDQNQNPNKDRDQNPNKDRDQQFKDQAKQEEKNKFDTSKAQDGWAQGASGNQYQSTRGYSSKPSSEDQNMKAGSGQSAQSQRQGKDSGEKKFSQRENESSRNLETERRTSSQSKDIGDKQFRQHERDAADVNKANQDQQKQATSGSQTMATEEERGEQTWTTGGQMNVKDPRKGLEKDQSQQKQQTMGEGMRTEMGGYEQKAKEQRAAQEKGHEKQAGIDSRKDQSSGKQKTVSGSAGSEADEEFFVTEMLVVSSNVDWEGLKRGQKPVILDFYKKGHEGSKRLHPKLAEKAKSNKGKWVFAGCDLEKDMVKSLVRDFNVSSAPTVMLFFEGKVVEQFTGHDEHKLDKIVKKAEELSSK